MKEKSDKTLLTSPYGGSLITLIASEKEKVELQKHLVNAPSIQISTRSLYDLELLATGAFSPLDRFMGKADYESVIETMRVKNGMLFPIPITLPIHNRDNINIGKPVILRSSTNEPVAIMEIEEIYEWDMEKESKLVYGTTDKFHPLVAEMDTWGKYYISGSIRVIHLPTRYDFMQFRHTPYQVRQLLNGLSFHDVVAFQTRNPMHRVHEEITHRAQNKINGSLLIHPVVGMTKPGDIDYFTRVQAYIALYNKYYDHKKTLLSLLPLAMRMAGPREAIWHAIIRRNYGANYFIIGRDHASPGCNQKGKPFYPPYAAQALLLRHQNELGVHILPFQEMVYVPQKKQFEEVDHVPARQTYCSLSGTKIRTHYIANHLRLPRWFTRPEVEQVLRRAYPPPHQQGFCVWFTGLPCAGKSTVAEILRIMIKENGREVTLLDGDIIRTHLSKGLGFTKEDRDTNILRIGFVASEIVRHNGVVVCAAVSPYETTRNKVRNLIGAHRFILVYVNTPQHICEKRDTKGLYAKARQGTLHQLTGFNDPYEIPQNPDITLTTINTTPFIATKQVYRLLAKRGLLSKNV